MKIYRSREGKLLGVCQGLAEATDYSVRYIRIYTVILALFLQVWVLAAYILAALLLPVKRPDDYESKGFKENFEDLRDDAEQLVKREYSGWKDAGKARKEKKESSSDL
jgi:phage shock protein C